MDKDLVKELELINNEVQSLNRKLLNAQQRYNRLERKVYYKLRSLPMGSYIIGDELAATISTTDVYSIKNWNDFINFVVKFKHYDLIPKKVNGKAYNKLMTHLRVDVPGINPYKKYGVKFINSKEVIKNGES